MASVTLSQVWIHRADDMGTYLRFYSADRGDTRAVAGEVRPYAQGRRRIVVRTGSAQILPVTLRLVTDADLDTLEEWRGVLLMLRDHHGRLVFGVYFSFDVKDYADGSGYDVALTFVESTHSIAV